MHQRFPKTYQNAKFEKIKDFSKTDTKNFVLSPHHPPPPSFESKQILRESQKQKFCGNPHVCLFGTIFEQSFQNFIVIIPTRLHIEFFCSSEFARDPISKSTLVKFSRTERKNFLNKSNYKLF